ncbi:MAG: hypothetical protein ACFFF9_13785 [Candidatus Thorarchaeota archaeon]
MQKQKGLIAILTATNVLLPYGTLTTSTVAMTTNQYWLFPLWIYLHDFTNWLNWSVIIPPFFSMYHLVLSLVGLIWLGFGFYIIYACYQYFKNKRDVESVRLLAQVLLVLQCLSVVIVGFMLYEYLLYPIPLPIHFLIVLYILRNSVSAVD